jgi:hypothetical protein
MLVCWYISVANDVLLMIDDIIHSYRWNHHHGWDFMTLFNSCHQSLGLINSVLLCCCNRYESLCVTPGDDESSGLPASRQSRSHSAAVPPSPPPAISRVLSPPTSPLGNTNSAPSTSSSTTAGTATGNTTSSSKWTRTFKQGLTRKGDTVNTGSLDLIGYHRVMRVLAVLIIKDKALLLFRDPSMSTLVGQWKMDKSWRYHCSPSPHNYIMLYRKMKPELPQLIFRTDALSREGWARALNGIGIKEKKVRREMLGPIGLAKAKARGDEKNDADDDDDVEDGTGTPAPEHESGTSTPTTGTNGSNGDKVSSNNSNNKDNDITTTPSRRATELVTRTPSGSTSSTGSSVLNNNNTTNGTTTGTNNAAPTIDRMTSTASSTNVEEKEVLSPTAIKRAQLRDVVGIPQYEAVFKQFMKKTFCEESYLFLEAAQAYRLSSSHCYHIYLSLSISPLSVLTLCVYLCPSVQ